MNPASSMKNYIIRYGEIGLKGLNRPFFENKLISNIKAVIDDKTAKITKKPGRIIIETENNISEQLKRVFGIVSFSIAERCEFDRLNDFIIEKIKNKKFETFRITANRINKRFPKTSEDLAREIGAFVVEKLGKKVSLKEYDLNVQIEIIDSAYVFFDRVQCLGGLPVGVEGKSIVLLETKNGIEAAKRVMKRGCDIIPTSFKKINIDEINDYLPVKKELIIIKDASEIDKIAVKQDARALVVEDFFDNLKDYQTKLAVLRPLAFD